MMRIFHKLLLLCLSGLLLVTGSQIRSEEVSYDVEELALKMYNSFASVLPEPRWIEQKFIDHFLEFFGRECITDHREGVVRIRRALKTFAVGQRAVPVGIKSFIHGMMQHCFYIRLAGNRRTNDFYPIKALTRELDRYKDPKMMRVLGAMIGLLSKIAFLGRISDPKVVIWSLRWQCFYMFSSQRFFDAHCMILFRIREFCKIKFEKFEKLKEEIDNYISSLSDDEVDDEASSTEGAAEDGENYEPKTKRPKIEAVDSPFAAANFVYYNTEDEAFSDDDGEYVDELDSVESSDRESSSSAEESIEKSSDSAAAYSSVEEGEDGLKDGDFLRTLVGLQNGTAIEAGILGAIKKSLKEFVSAQLGDSPAKKDISDFYGSLIRKELRK